MYLPINCAIIAQVYQDIGLTSTMIPKTMTQLYTILVLVLIRRHMIDTRAWNEGSEIPNKLEELPEDILMVLEGVGALAYRGLTAEEVQLIFSSRDVGKDFNHLGLLSVSRELYVAKGAKVSYSFFHLSMQEFLAAWYASCKPELIEHARTCYFKNLILRPVVHKLPAHLNAFVRFLAGFVGLSKLVSETFSMKKLLLCCFFEAQNPIQDHKLVNDFDYLQIDSSIDSYVCGYMLVHSPISLSLRTSTVTFNAVLSSLQHHSWNNTVSGTIKGLHINVNNNDGDFSPQMDELSEQVLQSISTLSMDVNGFRRNIEGLLDLLSSMSSLSGLEVVLNHDAQADYQNDYKIFKALHNIQNLKKITFISRGYTMSAKGERELKCFLRNNTVEDIKIEFYNEEFYYKDVDATSLFILGNNYHSIIEATLSCPSLKSLTTNIPFISFAFPSSLKCGHFTYPFRVETIYGFELAAYTETTLNCYICRIADLCADSSIKVLSISLDSPSYSEDQYLLAPKALCKFLAILNNSLYRNMSIESIALHFDDKNIYILKNIAILSHSLCCNTSVSCSEIRKSISLCDLTVPTAPQLKSSTSTTHSCPDLFHLQCLHMLHPLLHKELFEDILKIQYDICDEVGSHNGSFLSLDSDATLYEDISSSDHNSLNFNPPNTELESDHGSLNKDSLQTPTHLLHNGKNDEQEKKSHKQPRKAKKKCVIS